MHCALSIYPHTDNGLNQAMMIAKQNQVIMLSINIMYQVSNPFSFSGACTELHIACGILLTSKVVQYCIAGNFRGRKPL